MIVKPLSLPFLSKTTVRKLSVVSLATASLWLAGCSSIPAGGSAQPDYFGDRGASSAARVAFASCKREGLALDSSAGQQQSPAQYLSAARTFDQCLVELDPYRGSVTEQERMQVHALTVIDYLKGGDVAQARVQLRAFELSYPGADLYFADYTSFVDTLRSLLGPTDEGTSVGAGELNINPALRAELNRNNYWQSH